MPLLASGRDNGIGKMRVTLPSMCRLSRPADDCHSNKYPLRVSAIDENAQSLRSDLRRVNRRKAYPMGLGIFFREGSGKRRHPRSSCRAQARLRRPHCDHQARHCTESRRTQPRPGSTAATQRTVDHAPPAPNTHGSPHPPTPSPEWKPDSPAAPSRSHPESAPEHTQGGARTARP